MRPSHRIAVAALVSVVACLQPSEPGTGGLVLQFEGGAAASAALTAGKVIVKGPTDTTVTVTPGTNATIHLRTGTYTIALEGMDSGGVARFFQTTGVTIAPKQPTTVTVAATDFVPFVPAMNPLPSPSTSLSFTVSWGAMAGAVSYEVEIATNETFTANRLPFSAAGTSTTVTVSGSGTYYVRVRAIDGYQGRGRACASQMVQVVVPTIQLSTASANFGSIQGGANPAARTISVTNGGSGTLNGLSATVSYTSGTGWLAASLSSTTAPSTLTLTATTGSLAQGTYVATVSIASSVASNSPQTVSVSFTVGPPGVPVIVLANSSASFSATQGGANPPAQTISVTNGGDGTLGGLSASVSYTTGSGWLTASLSSTTAPCTLTLTATTGSLVAGTYAATVSVASSGASNSPRIVSVTFTVGPRPTIVLSPTSRSFSAIQGGANPVAQTVSVTNGASETTLSELSATVAYTTGSGWLTASLNATTAPSTLTLTVATGSLAAGTYTATVSVASSGASNSPQTVSVTFAVTPGADLVISAPYSQGTALSVMPTSVPPGGAFSLAGFTVTNQGTVATSGGTGIGFHFSIDSTLTATDPSLNASPAVVPQLAPGASFAVSSRFPLTIPSTQAPGDYFVGPLVDETNQIPESNDGNNFKSTALRVLAPDQDNDRGSAGSFDCGGASLSEYQSFTPTRSSLVAVQLRFAAGGGFPEMGITTRVNIRSGSPTGTILGTVTTFVAGPQTGRFLVLFQLPPGITITPGSPVVIEWPSTAGTVMSWSGSQTNPYTGGTAFGCNGVAIPSTDYDFKTF